MTELLAEAFCETFRYFALWFGMPYLLFLFIFLKKLLDKTIL